MRLLTESTADMSPPYGNLARRRYAGILVQCGLRLNPKRLSTISNKQRGDTCGTFLVDHS